MAKKDDTIGGAMPPSLPPDADEGLDLNPDGGLETLVDMRVPIHRHNTSTTNLPPVVQDPNEVRLQRMLAREHEVYGVPTPHIGRRTELEAVYDIVRQSVNTGTWRTIVVRGQPGMGKTRLIAELFGIIDPMRRGIEVLAVSASDTEPQDGLGIIAQLLRRRFDIQPTDHDDTAYDKVLGGLDTIVDDRLLTTAARLLAYLAGLKAAVVRTGEVRLDNLMRFHRRAVATLFNLLRYDATEKPHILVIHRAQYLTPRAIEVLTQAFSDLEQSPITLVLMTTGKLPRVLAPKSPECLDLQLGPLPDDEVEKLARALLSQVDRVPKALVADLVTRSAGNPGLLEDNFRLMIERGRIVPSTSGPWKVSKAKAAKVAPEAIPETVADVSAARVAAMSDELKEVLSLASVVGPTFWSAAVVALSRTKAPKKEGAQRDVPWVTDKRREGIEALLEKARQADLIIESKTSAVADSREFTFSSRPSCQALYEGLDEERRAKLHRMAAQWFHNLDKLAKTETGEEGALWSEAVASHLESGKRPERAAHHLYDAAQAAAAAYDLTKARELFRRGVALIDIDQADLLVRLLQGLGDVEVQRGELSSARRTFGTLLEATLLAGDSAAGANAWLRLGQVHRSRADYARARPCFQNALRLFRKLDDTQGIADALDEIAKLVWLRGGKGSYDEALDFFRRALEIRRVLGKAYYTAMSLSNVANIRLLRGEFKAALEGFREAMALRRRIGDRAGESMSHVGIGAVYYANKLWDKAADHWESGLGLAEAVGHRGLAGVMLNNLGEARLRQGRFDEAESLLGEAREVAEDTGDQRALADIARNRASVEAARGDWKSALKRAKSAVDQAKEIEAKTTLGFGLVTLGDLLSQAARLSEDSKSGKQASKADAAFEQAQRLFAAAGDVVGSLRVLETYAAHAKRWGDKDKAKTLRRKAKQMWKACQPLDESATTPVPESPRKRKATQPKPMPAVVPPPPPVMVAEDLPEAPAVPPLPELGETDAGVPRAPQHTLEFDASELQRGLIEVPPALARLDELKVPSKTKTKKKRKKSSSANKKVKKKASPKQTKLGHAPVGAPPPLPKGD